MLSSPSTLNLTDTRKVRRFLLLGRLLSNIWRLLLLKRSNPVAYAGTTAAILSNYSYVLKTFYLPAIREQINNATVLLNRLKRNTEDVAGKNATIAVHYGRNLGTIALPDGGLLPDAGYQKVLETIVPMKYNYGRITVSGPTIKATRTEKGAFAKAIDYEMKGLIKDVSKDLNRQLWGSGYGILGRWSSGASTSQVIQKAYLPAAGGAGFGSTFGSKYLMPEGATGMEAVIVVYTTGASIVVDATPLAPSAVTIGTLTDTVTVTDPVVTEAVGTVYIKGNATRAVLSGTSDVTRNEMMGLYGIVNDLDPDSCFTVGGVGTTGFTTAGTLQSLAVSNTWWKGQVFASSGGRYTSQRALTTELMQEAVDGVEAQLADDAGGALSPTIILTTRAIRRKYAEILKADKRFIDWKVMDGGFKVLEFNGIPMAVDNDAIDGEMYFVYEPSLAIYQMSDLEWMEEDGNVLTKIANYDAYEAILFAYWELGCSRRNVNAVLVDLSY
jgi:hypothetical protein